MSSASAAITVKPAATSTKTVCTLERSRAAVPRRAVRLHRQRASSLFQIGRAPVQLWCELGGDEAGVRLGRRAVDKILGPWHGATDVAGLEESRHPVAVVREILVAGADARSRSAEAERSVLRKPRACNLTRFQARCEPRDWMQFGVVRCRSSLATHRVPEADAADRDDRAE
jgi:hypothetical protein